MSSGLVGVVFVWAGINKLQSRGAWLAQARELGAPTWVALPLPPIEIVIGVVLILGWWPTPNIVAALVLLVAFTSLVAGNLMEGHRPPCACFGVRREKPISWTTVVRNASFIALLLVALLVG